MIHLNDSEKVFDNVQHPREMVQYIWTLAVQAWGPKFRFYHPHKNLGLAIHVSITPALWIVETGRLRMLASILDPCSIRDLSQENIPKSDAPECLVCTSTCTHHIHIHAHILYTNTSCLYTHIHVYKIHHLQNSTSLHDKMSSETLNRRNILEHNKDYSPHYLETMNDTNMFTSSSIILCSPLNLIQSFKASEGNRCDTNREERSPITFLCNKYNFLNKKTLKIPVEKIVDMTNTFSKEQN